MAMKLFPPQSGCACTCGIHVFVCIYATKIQCQRRCMGLPKADPLEYLWAMRDNEKSNDGQVSKGE